MRSIIVIALNDIRLLYRDKMAFFWVIGFPLMVALFFGTIFSGSGGGGMSRMKIAVVDQDQSDFSRQYVDKLLNSESFNVREMPVDSAENLVRRAKLTAYIVLRPGFENLSYFSTDDSSYIELGIDPSRRAEAGYLEGLLMQSIFMMFHDMFMDTGRMRDRLDAGIASLEYDSSMNGRDRGLLKEFLSSLRDYAHKFEATATDDSTGGGAWGMDSGGMMDLKIDKVSVSTTYDGPRSAYEVTFPSSVLWGLLACAATFATVIARERQGGTYLRLRLAPLTHSHILAGKGLSCFLACLAVSALILLVGHFAFGIRITSIPLLILAVLSAVLCFVGLMMFLSTLGKTEQAVGNIGWSVFLIMAMVGGGMIPLAFMPSWLLKISHFSPMKWSILAIEGAVWRGFNLTEMLLPVGILLAVGAVCFAIGVAAFIRTDG